MKAHVDNFHISQQLGPCVWSSISGSGSLFCFLANAYWRILLKNVNNSFVMPAHWMSPRTIPEIWPGSRGPRLGPPLRHIRIHSDSNLNPESRVECGARICARRLCKLRWNGRRSSRGWQETKFGKPTCFLRVFTYSGFAGFNYFIITN